MDSCSDAQRGSWETSQQQVCCASDTSLVRHTPLALVSCFLPQPFLLLCDAEAIWYPLNQMLLFCLKYIVQVTVRGREDPEGAETMRLCIVPRSK